MMSRKLRTAFIGGGWVTCNRHIPAAARIPDYELVGLISTDRNLGVMDRAVLSNRYLLRHYGSSLQESWLQDVDAVVIGTPPDTHHALVLQALASGKHVLVEKPFALSNAQADEMRAAAFDAKRALAVIHNFQFAKASTRAFELIRTGKIGQMRGVFGFQTSNHHRRLPRWYPQLPLGLFTDEAPHLIYMLLALLPNAEQVMSYVAPKMSDGDNTPRLVAAHFLSADGAVNGTLNMTFVGAVSEWYLTIFGSRRTLVIDFFRDILIDIPDDGRHETLDVVRTTLNAVTGHMIGYAVNGIGHLNGSLDYGNVEVMRRFADHVLHGQPLKGISADDGTDVVRVLQRIADASSAHGSGQSTAQRRST
jgi:predicted dehydrogenase